MSFTKIEDYLDKIEAISNYEKTKNENSDLNITNKDQQEQIHDLKIEEMRLKNLRLQYKDNTYSLEAFLKLVEKSTEE